MICLVFVLALSLHVAAIPSEYKRAFLGLFPGDTNTSAFPSHPTSHIIPKIPTRSFASSSTITTLSITRISSELWVPTLTSKSDSTASTPIKISLASTTSISPATAENQATADHSSKTWQIVGIAIIAVLFVATTITCAMFFDRLWRFLKDVLCCTSHPLVSEELISDYEKQTWDTRTLSPSPSDFKAPSLHTLRTRGLPWDTNALHRQLSRRNDHPPSA